MNKGILAVGAVIAAVAAGVVVMKFSPAKSPSENAGAGNDQTMANPHGAADGQAFVPAQTLPGSGKVVVKGSVEVAPDLVDRSKQISTIYVIVRGAQGGPPYAVQKVENPRSGTLEFEITDANVMMAGASAPENAKVVVRFDADGAAGGEAPGDLVGESEPIALGAEGVKVVVNRSVTP